MSENPAKMSSYQQVQNLRILGVSLEKTMLYIGIFSLDFPPKMSSISASLKSRDTVSVPRKDDAVYRDIFLGFSTKNVLISASLKSRDTVSVPGSGNSKYKDTRVL